MSKIGKINISIPDKVKVALAGSILNIEGPLGKSALNIDLEIFFNNRYNVVLLQPYTVVSNQFYN